MCLGIPMRVNKIDGQTAEVELNNIKYSANISFVSNLKAGDYVILHAGFAIQKMDRQKARQTLILLDELNEQN